MKHIIGALLIALLEIAADTRAACSQAPQPAAGPKAAVVGQQRPPAVPAQLPANAPLTPADLDQLAQLRPMLKAELNFAQQVCHLNEVDRKRLSDAGEEFLKTMLKLNLRGQQLLMVAGGPIVVNQAQPRARKIVQDRIAFVANTELPRATAAQFMHEHATRSEFQKRTAIENTISYLDDQLQLSPVQRNQIAKALSDQWTDLNVPALEMFTYEGYVPPIPTECLLPSLSPSQMNVWQTNGTKRPVGALQIRNVNFVPPGNFGALNWTEDE